MSSADILASIKEVQGKKEKLDAYIKELSVVKVTKSLDKEPDKAKMDGDKYDQHHAKVKKAFKSCKKDVNSEIKAAISDLKRKSADYGREISSLQVSYSVAVAAEAAQKLAEKAEREARKALKK
jgi:hypothetical protein